MLNFYRVLLDKCPRLPLANVRPCWVALGVGLMLAVAGAPAPAAAQSVWRGLVNETFETGTDNVSRAPATQLAPGSTDYLAVTTQTGIPDGAYAVTKNPNFSDDFGIPYNDQWQNAGDHTGADGYMALFNANPLRKGESDGTYYLYSTSTADIAGATYRIVWWGTNVLRYNAGPGYYNAYVGLTVRDQPDGGGALFATHPANGTAYARAVGNRNYLPWEQRTLSFQLPLTYASAAIYFNFFNSAPPGVTTSGNDVALDDLVIEMATARLSGRVYLDNNQNGVIDAVDGTAPSPLYVAAISNRGRVIDFAATASDGTYSILLAAWSNGDIG